MDIRTPLQRTALAVAAASAFLLGFMIVVVLPALTPAGLA